MTLHKELILPILQYPDPTLLTPAKPVIFFDETRLSYFACRMLETMKAENGLGITACQVGNPVSLMIVYDPELKITYTICNPQIVSAYGSQMEPEEGCLSNKG